MVVLIVANDAYFLSKIGSRGGWDEVGPIGEWAWLLLELPGPWWAGAVPIAWTIQVWSRTWRGEVGWIDRSGRLMGLGWTAWFIANTFHS